MNTDTRLTELEFHSLANIFPMMDAESLQSLSDDIKLHGLHESILVYEGKILDGRNRYRACNMAGVDPDFDTYDGDDPLSFVISRNLKRRQLTPGQLAFVALKIKDIEAERAKERQRLHGGTAPGKKANTAANLGGSVARDARDLAAKQVGVSHGYVTDAEKVRREAPELENKVVAGEVTLPQALREIKERSDEVRNPPANGNHRANGAGDGCTPPEIIEAVQDVLEVIELDPCSSVIANETVQAERIFTEDDDGLRKAWRAETLFLNPSKPLMSQFIEKLLDVMETGAVQESIALLRDCSDAAWFQRAGEMAGAICLAPGRISIFYFGPNADRFADRFDSIGLTVSTYWIRSAKTSVSPEHPITEAAKQPNSPVGVEPTPEQSLAAERSYIVDDDQVDDGRLEFVL